MRKLVTFVVLTALFAGCSSLNTFKRTKHLDFKPFAEYTISLAADIEYGLNQQRAYYLRDYRDDPYLDTLLMKIREQNDLIKGLAAAQPWVDEMARVSEMVFDRVNDDLDDVAL